MASIISHLDVPSSYRDQQYRGTSNEMVQDLSTSTTLYVGNLSFYTSEEQIYELFSKVGEIKRIIMGLDRNQKTPCGFCFVEYYHREDALDCMKYVNSTKLDERIIRTDLDPGFREGRQFGRGKSGGQVRDEYRPDYDAGRGGWGHLQRIKIEREREMAVKANYEASDVPTGAEEYKSRVNNAGKSSKRGRDDEEDDEEAERKRHNPRFREHDDDDDE